MGNAGRWSVHAGSLDAEPHTAHAVHLDFYGNERHCFAIDPRTDGLYVTDVINGIVRLDAATGLVERFAGEGCARARRLSASTAPSANRDARDMH